MEVGNQSPKPFQKLLIILLTLVFILVFPLVILEVLILICYRFVVKKLAIRLQPNLGNLVSLSSAPFAADLYYNKVPKTPLLVTVYLDGHLDLEDFRQRMLRVIDEKDVKTNSYIRPELQQYVTSWRGLLFWRWESNFDVTEHVRICDEFANVPRLNEDDIITIANELFPKPFNSRKSPWEFLVLHNTRAKHDQSNDPRTTIVFRIHHALADGYSLLKLVMKDMSGVQIRLAQPIRKDVKRVSFVEQCRFPIDCAFELAKTIVCCYDHNEWHLPEAKMTGLVNGGVSNPIKLEFVKSAKNKCQVTFAALLLAAFAGGVRKFMMNKGLKIPTQIHCFTVLPFSNHPYTLTNHLTGGLVLLPLQESSPLRRLATIHHSLENLKRSPLPTMMFYLMRLAGIQFGWLTWKTFWNALPTAVMSNFPGPEDSCQCLGLPILDGGFVAGFGPGNATVGFSSLSYNGNLRVAAGFDQSIVPESVPCQELVECILEEVSILKSLTTS